MHRSDIGDPAGQPVFIWLHGWGQDHHALVPLAKLLKRFGRHVLFDLPGFGQTPMLHKGAGTADYADALAKHLKRQNLTLKGPVILIGHSFGCRVSVQMAARHPALVRAVIMIGGAGLKRDRSQMWNLRASSLIILGRLARLSDKILRTSFRQAYTHRFGSADYRNAGDMRDTFVSVVTENLIAEAAATNCPTLLLYGSEDSETPPEIGQKYAALIRNSQYVELEGFGHLDILSRGAHQLEAQIKPFLKEVL